MYEKNTYFPVGPIFCNGFYNTYGPGDWIKLYLTRYLFEIFEEKKSLRILFMNGVWIITIIYIINIPHFFLIFNLIYTIKTNEARHYKIQKSILVHFFFKPEFLEHVIIGPIWDFLLIKGYLN